MQYSFAPALALSAMLFAGPASAQTAWKLDRSSTELSFVTHRFGAVVATGKFGRFDGALGLDFDHPEKSRIRVTIDTGSVTAGSSLMDGFIKGESMLDTARFPNASFTSTSVTRTSDRSLDIKGNLTIRSITQPITVSVTVDGDIERAKRGDKLPFSASGSFLRPAFEIGRDVNVVDDKVDLVIKGQVMR
ncbi:polyisoprenoid-binding protein [Bosea caraganae]|uniref:Polyisoprenoid-binding protein n=1 Tax=Bosea caraganae TaxID=2763117 RepID=A0A370L7I5_9HYPH|nr:YceI family protein [Bosea caraganae]RDJ24893.1 polyisoprenoid-binding protein [Bosea caraganae]RDJ26005.1 polyisoprenoid-binding protein [Bosea caraganae]